MGKKNTDSLVGIGLFILLVMEWEFSYAMSSTSKVGVTSFALVMGILMICIDRQMVVSQNAGTKKPPAISERFDRTIVA